MNWIKRFLYGLLLGITSIAPGISGGTIAIALGFYQHLIDAIANLLKEFKKNFLFLLPFAIGVAISMATLSVALEQLFTKAPLPTNALFIGLILGTFPMIRRKFKTSLDDRKVSWKHVITGLIFFIIVIIPVFSGDGSSLPQLNWTAEGGISTAIAFTIIGIIMAATLIIPGLSGTMILMLLGLYQYLLSLASSSVTAAVSFDIDALISLMPQLIPLGIGILIGGFLLAKVISRMFKAIPSYIYSAIIGLLCASPVVMLSQVGIAEATIINILISILTLIIGLFLVGKLGSEE